MIFLVFLESSLGAECHGLVLHQLRIGNALSKNNKWFKQVKVSLKSVLSICPKFYKGGFFKLFFYIKNIKRGLFSLLFYY